MYNRFAVTRYFGSYTQGALRDHGLWNGTPSAYFETNRSDAILRFGTIYSFVVVRVALPGKIPVTPSGNCSFTE